MNRFSVWGKSSPLYRRTVHRLQRQGSWWQRPSYYVRLIFRKPRSVFVRPHEKRQSGVFKNMYSEDRFQKTCVFGAPKRIFFLWHSRPRILLEAWAWGPGGSGDTGFKVLDFRTSARFWFKSNLEDPLLKALNHQNLQSSTLRQEQVNAIRNVVDKSEMTGSLKSLGLQLLCPFIICVTRASWSSCSGPQGALGTRMCVWTKGSLVPWRSRLINR